MHGKELLSERRDKMARQMDQTAEGVVSNVFPFMDLPCAIMFHVFFLLPINAITQCKLVFKAWKTLLSDSHFSANYMQTTPFKSWWLTDSGIWGSFNNVAQLEISRNGECFLSPIEMMNERYRADNEKFMIIGSCNGVTCLFIRGSYSSDQIYLNTDLTCGESIDTLPESDDMYDEDEVYVFGFCPSANKLKVVRFVFFEDRTSDSEDDDERDCYHQILTYQQDRDWRILPRDSISLPSYFNEPFISFKGVVHWINKPVMVISTFDLGEEIVGQISLPLELTNLEFKQLKVLSDCFSLVDYSGECDITIWTRKEYSGVESWTKDYFISVTPQLHLSVRPSYQHHSPHLNVVAMLPTVDILFSFANGNPPMCYNPQRKEWTNVHVVSSVDWSRYKIAGSGNSI